MNKSKKQTKKNNNINSEPIDCSIRISIQHSHQECFAQQTVFVIGDDPVVVTWSQIISGVFNWWQQVVQDMIVAVEY